MIVYGRGVVTLRNRLAKDYSVGRGDGRELEDVVYMDDKVGQAYQTG